MTDRASTKNGASAKSGASTTMPPKVLGMLGGGQLGRMSALAAYRLGLEVVGLFPEADAPLSQVCPSIIQADYMDFHALDDLVARCDAITLEFENIPYEALAYLARSGKLRPGADLVGLTQDRLSEKQAIERAGLRPAPYRQVDTARDLAQALADLGGQGILKTRRLGYDGKGQQRLSDADDLEAVWRSFDQPCVLEGLVDFAWEGSVIVARRPGGLEVQAFPLVENRHENHILSETLAPAPQASGDLAQEAERQARVLAESLSLEGLLGIEFFVTSDGLIVNEMAPRPHNSGHWSQAGASVDQFEQHVRAVMDLPLAHATIICPTRMVNLLGEAALDQRQWLQHDGAQLHLYGKRSVKAGRKMGHVNILTPEGFDTRRF